MAKGNMFLGLARGSVGDVTFYRRNAQQISRVRVRKVKNPQSNAQMWQRAINHTAVEAYSVLKSICDHSYQGISYGSASYSKFLSLNMDMLRREAGNTIQQQSGQRAYCPFGFKGISAMPYIISQGSINGADATFTAQTGEDTFEAVSLGQLPNVQVLNFTYRMMADLLHAQQGDQITILRIPNPALAGFEDEPLGRNLMVARVILDPSSGDFETEPFFDPAGQGAPAGVGYYVNSPNIRNEGNFVFATGGATGNELFASVGAFENDNIGFAFVTSRQSEDGTWLRSNAVFLYNPLYRENGYTLKQASDLGQIDLYVENDKYLNNAE